MTSRAGILPPANTQSGSHPFEAGSTAMDFSRRARWIRIALIILAIGAPLTAAAQGRGGGVAEPYTPAKDAKDLKAVLFNWERNQGMLKGHDERDMVAMLEYQGKGTIQVNGEPCTLTKY